MVDRLGLCAGGSNMAGMSSQIRSVMDSDLKALCIVCGTVLLIISTVVWGFVQIFGK
jgi:hypothetical protein